jgi:hypothetical protein
MIAATQAEHVLHGSGCSGRTCIMSKIYTFHIALPVLKVLLRSVIVSTLWTLKPCTLTLTCHLIEKQISKQNGKLSKISGGILCGISTYWDSLMYFWQSSAGPLVYAIKCSANRGELIETSAFQIAENVANSWTLKSHDSAVLLGTPLSQSLAVSWTPRNQ